VLSVLCSRGFCRKALVSKIVNKNVNKNVNKIVFLQDVALLTDGRFSGGSHGFVIGHITPEAQARHTLRSTFLFSLILPPESSLQFLFFFISSARVKAQTVGYGIARTRDCSEVDKSP
jgi:hypothetical protein